MIRPVLRRLALAIPVLFIVSALTFVLTSITPGDPARALLGTKATEQAVQAFNRSLGLDRPIYEQYWSWLNRLLHGSLGDSVFTGEPVTSFVSAGLPVTLTLLIGATLISAIAGIALGVLSVRRGGLAGRFVDAVSTLGFAVPSFWLGVLAVLLFSHTLRLLPPSGWVPFSTSPTDWARFALLPVLTLAVQGVTLVAKQTRDGMLEEMGREYVRTLRARGISERSIVYKHALRNAMPNAVTMIALYTVSLLLGTTVVESVFALHGLGTIAVQATGSRDLPILQGVGITFAVIVLVVFCLADIARAWLNPKLRTAR